MSSRVRRAAPTATSSRPDSAQFTALGTSARVAAPQRAIVAATRPSRTPCRRQRRHSAPSWSAPRLPAAKVRGSSSPQARASPLARYSPHCNGYGGAPPATALAPRGAATHPTTRLTPARRLPAHTRRRCCQLVTMRSRCPRNIRARGAHVVGNAAFGRQSWSRNADLLHAVLNGDTASAVPRERRDSANEEAGNHTLWVIV